ncbi:PilN domain-containing protein [Sutcliffiella halmapala]|uniref:PilN domain-containing protein n=1 Tax=Sutcliffiella halmapala TaxID=79882 RepID=UPI00099532AB|nr:PilN domain-containing protein [Sutcliffiella halmapala]
MKSLVEINLLPRKQARNITTPLVYGICTFFVILVVVSFFVFSTLVNQDLNKAEQELQAAQALRVEKEEAILKPQSSSSIQRLENTIVWAEEYPVEMVPVMQELVRLLPSRGFVQNFTYSETGTLNVTVQFDESRDAAYYLHHLNEASYFKVVNLTSISTSTIDEEASNDVLPRYIAQYDLIFDRNAIKTALEIEAEEDAEDGGGES